MNNRLVDRAADLEQQGDCVGAALLCRQALGIDPRDGRAWHLSGRIALQQGDLPRATDAFARAAQLLTDNADVHYDFGNALLASGQHAAALACYDRAISVQPDHADALFERGNVLFCLDRPEDALGSFQQAARIVPKDAEAHYGAGKALLLLGQAQDALVSFDRTIALDPDHAEALHASGKALATLGRHQDALERQTRVLELQPDFVAALTGRGRAAHALNRTEDAAVDFARAVDLDPGDPDLWYNLGVTLLALNRLIEAVGSFERAIALAPGTAASHLGRGLTLKALNRIEPSLAAFDAALAIDPTDVQALNERGIALQALNRHPEALACFEAIQQLGPPPAEVLSNLGNILQILGRTQEALGCYDQALADKPGFGSATLNRAYCRLKLGHLPDAWRDYEARWQDPGIASGVIRPDAPLWLGAQSLAGRTILVLAEQGFGDSLHFCRYAKLLAARGARVIVEVPKPLVRLLARVDGVAAAIAAGDPRPIVDFHCPMMSLPLAFGTTLDTIPGEPYLSADPSQAAVWRRRLDEVGPGQMKIGLVWAGMARTQSPDLRATDLRRSATLARFAPLAEVPGIALVSLQKGPPGLQARQAHGGLRLYDPTHFLDDFADTAALVTALDLVISVDTSVAHVAGGLGRPVWVLNRFDSCWRWLENRADSPWYPSARLFRQQTPGDWAGVMAEVAGALKDMQRA